MKKAGIIGGKGFIESEIISLFLQKHFEVKVSTSDITKTENYQHLMELDHSEHLHVCEVNHKTKSELEHFTKDCDYIVYIDPLDLST